MSTKYAVTEPPCNPYESAARVSPKLVIVGAGFCGTALAISLLRTAGPPLTLTFIESRYPIGRGVAYSTTDERHLLNVPAKSMSALPDDESHFVDWLRRPPASAGLEHRYGPNDYVPRRVYGDYLQDTLDCCRAQAHGTGSVHVLQDEVVGLDTGQGSAILRTAAGRRLTADAVVLALGNLPPRSLPEIPGDLRATGLYRPDPWSPEVLDALNPDTDVLILGTGLTMVDLVISLKGRGHRGSIFALSRRGLLPRHHLREPVDTSAVPLSDDLGATRPHTLANLVRRVRRAVRNHPGPWQEVVDSLRELTPTLWRELSPADQARFLHRYRTYWDVHRSRVAPGVADTLAGMLESGQLQVVGGALRSVARARTDTVQVFLHERSGRERSFTVGRVINATGPEMNLLYTAHPLLQQLVASGTVQPDATGLGISVDSEGRALGQGYASIYVLGPLRRNESYEGTAVPELRVQSREMADTLRRNLAPTSAR